MKTVKEILSEFLTETELRQFVENVKRQDDTDAWVNTPGVIDDTVMAPFEAVSSGFCYIDTPKGQGWDYWADIERRVYHACLYKKNTLMFDKEDKVIIVKSK